MDEKIENPQLKEIIKIAPEDMDEEELEIFVDSFMDATLIVPAHLKTDNVDIENMSDEEIALAEEIDFEILRLEDEEGNVFIPTYTDDEISKLDFEVYGLIFVSEDLAKFLFESDDEIQGILINPFSENSVEIPIDQLIDLFDIGECDD